MIVPLEKPGTPEELVHFGVKGMKWGVRNEDTSTSGGSSGEQKKHLSDRQKKILIGAAATAVILGGAYGAYKLHDSRTRSLIGNGEQSIGSPFVRKESLARKMSPKQIMSEVVSKANPDYGTDPRASRNCRRATFAYELRRRGYDVQATKTVTGKNQGPEGLVSAISGDRVRDALTLSGWGRNGIKLESSKPGQNASRIFNALGKHPEGARGELGMGWGSMGGHSMAWEIIGGKPHIFDAQTSTHYATPKAFHKVAKHVQDAAFTRLDDISLNESFLTDWVKNAG